MSRLSVMFLYSFFLIIKIFNITPGPFSVMINDIPLRGLPSPLNHVIAETGNDTYLCIKFSLATEK